MSWVVIILFVSLLIYLYKLCTPSSHLWKYGNLIPGPRPLPIVGNGLVFLFGKTRLETFCSITRQYGPVSRIWVGKELNTLLTDPKDIEAFLSNSDHNNKSAAYRYLETWLGTNNLVSAKYEIWKVHRKALTPSFHFKILENAVGMIERHTNVLCQQLDSKVGQPEFDIGEYLEKYSLDVICETAMGIDLQSQTASHPQYLEYMKKLAIGLMIRSIYPWFSPEIIFRMSSYGREFFASLHQMVIFIRKVIQERKAILTNENSSSNPTYDHGTRKQKQFMDFLLQESNFSDREIEDEVQTIMVTGSDTSKTSISFCMYELSKNPEVQEKLIHEIDEMIARKGEQLSIQDYSSMRYLDNIVKETLRLYTVIPIIGRRIFKDFQLPSGFTIPANSEVMIFLYFMHNDEKIFEEPERFKPERFDNREGRNPYEFIPFSAGARNCIGQKFALLEMKITLFRFFQKYRLLPAIENTTTELELSSILMPQQGLYVKIARRS